jgi:transcriptional regulator with XRE-family HTH domain
MSIRSERIKALVEQSDLSYQELEKLTGIKKSSLQRYASGATTKIPLDVIEKLSAAFNVSQEYLMGWDEKKDSPSEGQLTGVDKELFDLLKLIPEDQKRLFLEMGRVFANNLNKD